jgi:hypothetical protein
MKPKTRVRLNRSKSPEITQTKLGLPLIDPPLGALPIGLAPPPPLLFFWAPKTFQEPASEVGQE